MNNIISKKYYDDKIVYAIIFCTILTPDLNNPIIPAFRLEHLMCYGYILYMIYTKKEFNILNRRIVSILLYLFSINIMVSILIGSYKGVNVVINDLFELYKIFAYFCVFIVISNCIRDINQQMKILSFINICISISAIIAITQYIDLFNLNELYVHIIAPTQYKTLIGGYPYPRVVGISNNPNVYAIISSIGILINLFLIMYSTNKYIWVTLVLNFTALIMTSSRTGLIFLFVGIIIFYMLYFKEELINLSKLINGKVKVRTVFIFIIVISIIFTLPILMFKYIPEQYMIRFNRIFDLKNDTSWQARLVNWQFHIDAFKENFIFGLGPWKTIPYEEYADNEWILLGRRYGIIGIFNYISICIFPIVYYWKNIKKSKCLKLYISIIVASYIYMIPASIYHIFQSMTLVIIIYAVLLGNDRSIEFK